MTYLDWDIIDQRCNLSKKKEKEERGIKDTCLDRNNLHDYGINMRSTILESIINTNRKFKLRSSLLSTFRGPNRLQVCWLLSLVQPLPVREWVWGDCIHINRRWRGCNIINWRRRGRWRWCVTYKYPRGKSRGTKGGTGSEHGSEADAYTGTGMLKYPNTCCTALRLFSWRLRAVEHHWGADDELEVLCISLDEYPVSNRETGRHDRRKVEASTLLVKKELLMICSKHLLEEGALVLKKWLFRYWESCST